MPFRICRSFVGFRGVLCALLITWAGTARAVHYMGGNITWQCQGGDDYLVSLDLFFDCSAGTAGINQLLHVQSACASFDTLINVPQLVEVSQICQAELPSTSCNGGGWQGVVMGSYQVVLHLPPCPGGWTLWWSTCCRGSTLDLVGAAGLYVEGVLRNDLAACDDSPVFTQNAVPYSCVGQAVNYNFGVTEADGDSLVYSLISARGLGNSPNPIGYVAGHTPDQPVAGATMDPVTGQLQFTPTVIGNTVFVMAVDQYDASGTYIGTVMRDILFVSVPCNGSAPQPVGNATLNGPSGPGSPPSPGTLATGTNAFQVCDGQPICFSLVFADADPGTILQVQSQVLTLLPGSTMDVVGTDPVTITVCWTGQAANSPVNVPFSVNDGACPIQNSSSMSVNIVTAVPAAALDPGTDSAVTLCSGGGLMDLFPMLGGTPQAGGSWTAPDGSVHSGQLDPTNDPPGGYVYTLSNLCLSASATVQVAIAPPPDAGMNGNLVLCGDGSSVPLFPGLGGTPDPGGDWTVQGGGPTSGMYDPQTQTPAVFLYTVQGAMGCATAVASVSVSEVQPADAGADGFLSICTTGAAVDLFQVLGGVPSAQGTWSGPDAVVNGLFDPVAMLPGVYTYTVTGSAPCTDVQATVTVTEVPPPDAGLDSSVALCADGSAVGLFSLLGGDPMPGGTWAGPDPVPNGLFDPGTMAPGPYVYSLPAMAPCGTVTATVTIDVVPAQDPGLSGVLVSCGNGLPISLLSGLGGTPDPGGTWSGPSPVVNGTYDPTAMDAGTYTYAIAASATCAGVQSTVLVQEEPAPDAGADAMVALCSTGSGTVLLPLLQGAQSGGTWIGPGGAFDGIYDPGTDLPGTYTYVVAGIAPCQSDQASVEVSEVAASFAGRDTTVLACANGAPFALFPLVPDAQVGGSWANGFNGSFMPGTTVPGTFMYSVSGNAPCAADTALVLITLSTPPDAGSSGSLTVCDQGAATSLIAVLGTAEAGGTWTGPSAVVGDAYDPVTMAPGAYTYTVTGTAPCLDAAATVQVIETDVPDAGFDGAIALCGNAPPTDLFLQLGGNPDPGGFWNGPSTIVGGIWDPATDLPGTYTYALSAMWPCPGASAHVEVTVEVPPNAGSDAIDSICSGAAPFNLLDLLQGQPQAGGQWTYGGTVVPSTFDPAMSLPGDYLYTVVGVLCASSMSTVSIGIHQAPDAGTNNVVALCSNGPVVNLGGLLAGSPEPGGTWSGPGGASVPGTLDPAIDQEGVYTYTVDGPADCPSASADLTVSISTAANAGEDAALDLCSSQGTVLLTNALDGTPDPGGTWSGPVPVGGDGALDAATALSGTYIYTVTPAAPCPAAVAQVVVAVTPALNAGQDSQAAFCSTAPAMPLIALVPGAPDTNGTWMGPNGVTTGPVFTPGLSVPGTYTYEVPALAACPAVSAALSISVADPLLAGGDGDTVLCANGAPFPLATLLQGPYDTGGWWTGPAGAVSEGQFDPASDPSGTYIHTVDPNAPCVQDTAFVNVLVEPVPVVDPVFTLSPGCAPVAVTFQSGYAAGGACTWDLGDGTTAAGCDSVLHLYGTPGTYAVHFTTLAPNGCSVTVALSQDVQVAEAPEAAFTADASASSDGPMALFTNTSSGANGYLWDFDGAGTSTLTDPRFTFPFDVQGPYVVCLTAFATPTCADTFCSPITVPVEARVHVPNGFSPDGDGRNDLFRPVLTGVSGREYLFLVMDRWGREVFVTHTPDAGWDGRLPDGSDAPIGVYVWTLKAFDAFQVLSVERKGHVTLLR